ncbi:MarR family transcriptional regulator [Bacillus coahuilensis m2-6]|uniref:winged helix-turn-helix transcriptional regulator n=1 Tax=Bacillus coahuilensis TaxID=408580 RepID=UPI00018506DC|nr:helix-turn-helix domain-containing protein [Bacillus coahuilensis]KUP04487.1 MarR family transcriptional regulator [Bacillus coahuilensis m2-6]
MKPSNVCPRFEKAIQIVSQRWTGLIVYQLLTGPQRFNEIQGSIGISGKVLSDRLKDLEQEGIVERTVIPSTPVMIEYSLTKKGAAMEPVINQIESWSREWI